MVYHMYHMTCHHIIFVLDISVTFLHHDIFVTSALGPSSSHNVASPPQFVLSVVKGFVYDSNQNYLCYSKTHLAAEKSLLSIQASNLCI